MTFLMIPESFKGIMLAQEKRMVEQSESIRCRLGWSGRHRSQPGLHNYTFLPVQNQLFEWLCCVPGINWKFIPIGFYWTGAIFNFREDVTFQNKMRFALLYKLERECERRTLFANHRRIEFPLGKT